MGCGCTKKHIPIVYNIGEDQKQSKIKDKIEKEQYSDKQAKVYIEGYVNQRIERIVSTVSELLPFFMGDSEEDITCLECCEKHLGKAAGFFDEARTKKYRYNTFLAIGQLGLAEGHVTDLPELQDLIRESRLTFMRGGYEPKWEVILESLDKNKQERANEQEDTTLRRLEISGGAEFSGDGKSFYGSTAGNR